MIGSWFLLLSYSVILGNCSISLNLTLFTSVKSKHHLTALLWEGNKGIYLIGLGKGLAGICCPINTQ